LARHYLEMVVAMMLAMGVLGFLRMAAGISVSSDDHPTVSYLIMAVDMSIGMVAVMRWRRHRWRHIAEMCLAMFAPVVLFLIPTRVLSTDMLMVLAHLAMFLGMLGIVLARREVYASHTHPSRPARHGRKALGSLRKRVTVLGKVAGALLVAVAIPVGVAAPAVMDARAYFYTEPPGQMPPESFAAPARHDPEKPTAVVVLGNQGTNAADALPPYEVLAASEAFNVYTVAPRRQLVPLVGGLDLLPDLDFAQLERLLDGPPDLVVVPQIEDEPAPRSPIIAWLDEQRSSGSPLIVGVCVGAEILAEAGYLDERPATSHWVGLIGLRRSHPDVNWVDYVRYVDDGDIITSAGVLSGIDGTLRGVERIAGAQAAARSAKRVQWPFYSPGRPAVLEPVKFAPADSVALLSASYRWDREDLGVLLTDGATETELASVFRGYTEFNFLAKPLAFTLDGKPIRSRHGLVFVPRADAAQAGAAVDRILVPGAAAAARRDVAPPALPGHAQDIPLSYPHAEPGFAFNGILVDIAERHDRATAQWVAKSLQYPIDGLELNGALWPWALTLRFALLVAAGLALAITTPLLVRRRRTRRQPRAPHPAQPDGITQDRPCPNQLTPT
jgi:putative intracellular protease/amidase